MTMLFDIEQYHAPDSQNHKGDWDGVKYDSAWDDGSAFPEKNYEPIPLIIKRDMLFRSR